MGLHLRPEGYVHDALGGGERGESVAPRADVRRPRVRGGHAGGGRALEVLLERAEDGRRLRIARLLEVRDPGAGLVLDLEEPERLVGRLGRQRREGGDVLSLEARERALEGENGPHSGMRPHLRRVDLHNSRGGMG